MYHIYIYIHTNRTHTAGIIQHATPVKHTGVWDVRSRYFRGNGVLPSSATEISDTAAAVPAAASSSMIIEYVPVWYNIYHLIIPYLVTNKPCRPVNFQNPKVPFFTGFLQFSGTFGIRNIAHTAVFFKLRDAEPILKNKNNHVFFSSFLYLVLVRREFRLPRAE